LAQIKIYGEREHLGVVRQSLSDVIHEAATTCLGLPAEKRFHRFIRLDLDDFSYPSDRGPAYTIIEVSLFEGRSEETKRAFLKALMSWIPARVGLDPIDLEITLFETPKSHWGIRGKIGDELELSYDVRR
jgi:phenylpyruvate tautomerase PptA (4-oxalocrotonate tautomerase family)